MLGPKTESESKQSQGAVISCCLYKHYYSLPAIRQIELTIVRGMLIMHEISFSPFLIIRLPIVNKGLEFGTGSGELRSFLLQHVQNAKDEFPSALSHDSLCILI